jgi:hypothetical protein
VQESVDAYPKIFAIPEAWQDAEAVLDPGGFSLAQRVQQYPQGSGRTITGRSVDTFGTGMPIIRCRTGEEIS